MILAIDCGTSSTRTFLFDINGEVISCAQAELTQYYPADGWVEQDAEEIWQQTLAVCKRVLQLAQVSANEVFTCGITNQRETVILWDKKTDRVLHRAIVWQDRRTTEHCQQLQKDASISQQLQQKTGLLADPYFSATKIQWLLNHDDSLKSLVTADRLAFGTVDSFLLWRLSRGKQHATDATNASRTLLFNINTQQWDDDLLTLFQIPANILPQVLDSNATFAKIHPEFLGSAIPITGIAGDQQAALIGQACLAPGMMKATYGTGGFLLLNTGTHKIQSKQRLLTTIAYRLNNQVTYGLEGSIFNTGTTIKWLRDNLGIIKSAAQSETLAKQVVDNGGVYFIPAFTGLGAPHWHAHARAMIIGLTHDSKSAHIVRAALEAVAYQTFDVVQAMEQDYQSRVATIRVDGGMTNNRWLLQFLADILERPIEPSKQPEVTTLGVALLAGLGANMYSSIEQAVKVWQGYPSYQPQMQNNQRERLLRQWQKQIDRLTS